MGKMTALDVEMDNHGYVYDSTMDVYQSVSGDWANIHYIGQVAHGFTSIDNKNYRAFKKPIDCKTKRIKKP